MAAAVTVVATVGLLAGSGSAAGASAQTLYVAPNGSDASTCGQATPCLTIGRAVQQANPGDTVLVDAGTYSEDVLVTKELTIIGLGLPVVDASGKSNGFLLSGQGADGTTLEGFKVQNATFEGILARQTSRVTIARNLVVGNDRGENAHPLVGECAALQPGTKSVRQPLATAADDRAKGCGEALHLMSTTHSDVIDNQVNGNSGGIYLTDEFGPAAHNLIAHNVVSNNTNDCGITLASHSKQAVSHGRPRPSVAGVYDNTIAGNVADHNGLGFDGAGILIGAAFIGGAAYNNLVLDNTVAGNSLPGIAVHSHGVNQDLNGNVIMDNTVGRNAINGGPHGGPGDRLPNLIHTAGIEVFSPLIRLRGTVIFGNHITGDYYGIWTRLVQPLQRGANSYSRVHSPLVQLFKPL